MSGRCCDIRSCRVVAHVPSVDTSPHQEAAEEERAMGQPAQEHARRRVRSCRVRSWRDDLPVAAVAALASGLGWAVATLCGVDLVVRTGSATQHVNVVSVVVTAVVVTIAGGGLLRVLERRTKSAVRLWTTIAAAVLLVSLAGPLGAETVAAGSVLAGLHLVVGGVVIVGLRRSTSGRVA